MRTGRCLCGDCGYEIDGEPVIVAACHCIDCQRISGAGHATGAMFAEEGVRITGTPSRFVLTSEAGNTVTRLFCGRCGSPLFGMNTGMPGFVTVTLGTMDVTEGLTPQVAVFTRSKRAWDEPAAQSFDDQPGWKPAGETAG